MFRTKRVAALFVDPRGPYSQLSGVECWDETRDARQYPGPHPVVAHPPCQLWTNLAAVNWKRYARQRPAWYPEGDDGGCFTSALQSVLTHGGVLEHPAYTHAWEHYGLTPPNLQGWSKESYYGFGTSPRAYWVCEVWQSAYNHLAKKRTWFLYCGKRPPFELDWSHKPGTHQIGWFDRLKPTLGKREASLTPVKLAETLVSLARWSRG